MQLTHNTVVKQQPLIEGKSGGCLVRKLCKGNREGTHKRTVVAYKHHKGSLCALALVQRHSFARQRLWQLRLGLHS